MLNFQANVINMYQLCNNNLVDTGHKLNVDKTFRRRPGRLLNVLCTFNLRPLSTEKGKKYSGLGVSINQNPDFNIFIKSMHGKPSRKTSFLAHIRNHLKRSTNSQKQPPEVFCKKRCSQKFRKIQTLPDCYKQSQDLSIYNLRV